MIEQGDGEVQVEHMVRIHLDRLHSSHKSSFWPQIAFS